MTDRYARIRKALAMGPTPGPWKASYQSVLGPLDMAILYAVVPCFFGTDGRYSVSVKEATANAALCAACDPDTIRELMEERDALAAKVASYERADRDLNEALNMGDGSYRP